MSSIAWAITSAWDATASTARVSSWFMSRTISSGVNSSRLAEAGLWASVCRRSSDIGGPDDVDNECNDRCSHGPRRGEPRPGEHPVIGGPPDPEAAGDHKPGHEPGQSCSRAHRPTHAAENEEPEDQPQRHRGYGEHLVD